MVPVRAVHLAFKFAADPTLADPDRITKITPELIDANRGRSPRRVSHIADCGKQDQVEHCRSQAERSSAMDGQWSRLSQDAADEA
jgi:hypothetical protein